MRRLLLLALTLVVSIGSMSAPAAADPPMELEATGERLSLTVVPPFSQNGNVSRYGLAVETNLSGDFESTEPNAETFRCKTVVKSGRTICHGESLFTGTIAGVGEGTTLARVVARCDADGCEVRFRIEGVSGDLANVRGTGTAHIAPNGISTFSIRLHSH